MAGADLVGGGLAGHGAILLVKAHALVARRHARAKAGMAAGADFVGHADDLPAPFLAPAQHAAQRLERFEEKGLDEVRLQAVRLRALHFLADGHDAVDVHGVLGQRPFLEQGAQFASIQRAIHHLIEPRPRFGQVAVADGLDEQIAQAALVEGHLAEDVEHLAAQGAAFLLQLFKQALVDRALARLAGDEVPQMADLRLADAVDAAKALFQAVGVPGQVVVDHQVGALQVDALAGGVRGDEHAHVPVLLKQRFHAAALIAEHAAVDGDHQTVAAKERANFGGEVVERVAVFGKDNELFAAAVRRAQQGVVLQKGGKFVPLAILPAPAHGVGHGFKAAQRSDLRLQFGNGGGGRCLVGHGLLLPFQFAGGQVVKIVQIVRQVKGFCAVRRATALRFLRKARFQPLAPAAQGLIDGLRRGGEAALEDGQREADGSAAVAGKGVRAVELLLHIIRHGGVKLRLHGRKVVVDRVGQALRKERRAIEFEQVFLHQTAHDVGNVDGLVARAADALEAVGIDQRHEELEIRLLAVVRRGREQEEVARKAGEQAAELVALRAVHLAAPEGGGHLVRLVADDEVPLRGPEFLLHFRAAGELVQPRDAQVGFLKGVAGDGGGQAVVGEDLKAQVELLVELVLPLFGQIARADDQAAAHIAADHQFLDEQAGHDGLARAWVVRQHVAQRLTGQHFLVYRRDLVRQRLDGRGVHGQIGVEEVREVDAVGLRDEAKLLPRRVETPRQALLHDLQRGFILAEEELRPGRAAVGLVDDLHAGAAVPLDRHDGDRLQGQYAAHDRAGGQVFQSGHGLSPSIPASRRFGPQACIEAFPGHQRISKAPLARLPFTEVYHGSTKTAIEDGK